MNVEMMPSGYRPELDVWCARMGALYLLTDIFDRRFERRWGLKKHTLKSARLAASYLKGFVCEWVPGAQPLRFCVTPDCIAVQFTGISPATEFEIDIFQRWFNAPIEIAHRDVTAQAMHEYEQFQPRWWERKYTRDPRRTTFTIWTGKVSSA